MSTPPPAQFDPGLQPERTSLAWRRTILSMVVGSVVSARLLHDSLASKALVATIPLVLAAGIALYVLHRRHRGVTSQLTNYDRGTYASDGRLQAAVATMTVILGLIAAVYVFAE